ncbi:MAG: hypothetical protein U0441_28065 [Polyangiaceae bacterium]
MSDLPRPPRTGQDPPAARHLRLVSDKPSHAPPKRYRRTPTFTPAETDRLRAALKSTRWVFGTYLCAADAMRIPVDTLYEALSGRKAISANIAVRLARALGKPLESLYRAPTDASTCPTCGARRAP